MQINKLHDIASFVESAIAPGVLRHGGHVEIVELTDSSVSIGLSGACSMCSLDQLTREGIRSQILSAFPDLDDCVVVTLSDLDSRVTPSFDLTDFVSAE